MSTCSLVNSGFHRSDRLLVDLNSHGVVIPGLDLPASELLAAALRDQCLDAVFVGVQRRSSDEQEYSVRRGAERCVVRQLAFVGPLIRDADLVIVTDSSLDGLASLFEVVESPRLIEMTPVSVVNFASKIREKVMTRARAHSPIGLVLAGGKSQRMGRDKALLSYRGGLSQLEASIRLLGSLCSKVLVSAGSGRERFDESLSHAQILTDRFCNLGPLGGILTAQQAYPGESLLVLAVDLPGLQAETLEHLMRNRDPLRFATAYASTRDQGVEALCAIYEPKSFAALLQAVALDRKCPVKILSHLPVRVLNQRPGIDDLRNINTPEERLQFLEEDHIR